MRAIGGMSDLLWDGAARAAGAHHILSQVYSVSRPRRKRRFQFANTLHMKHCHIFLTANKVQNVQVNPSPATPLWDYFRDLRRQGVRLTLYVSREKGKEKSGNNFVRDDGEGSGAAGRSLTFNSNGMPAVPPAGRPTENEEREGCGFLQSDAPRSCIRREEEWRRERRRSFMSDIFINRCPKCNAAHAPRPGLKQCSCSFLPSFLVSFPVDAKRPVTSRLITANQLRAASSFLPEPDGGIAS